MPATVIQPMRREAVMPKEKKDKTIYKVAINREEQYSIWPTHRENTLGWDKELAIMRVHSRDSLH
jgi:uncharacterized protein YbdZ (MbtH family)